MSLLPLQLWVRKVEGEREREEISQAPTNLLIKGVAFRVFDFTKEQLLAVLDTVNEKSTLLNAFGKALGFCAIRHASFLCELAEPRGFFRCLLQYKPLGGTEADAPEIVGLGNFWEAALGMDKFRTGAYPKMMRSAVNAMKRWPAEVASNPRIVQIVQMMNDRYH